MDRLANGRLYRLRRLRSVQIHNDATRMLLLQIGFVDSPAKRGAQIGVLDVADNANDSGVKLYIVSAALSNRVSDCVLRGAEESLGKGKVYHRNIGPAHCIGWREFSAHQDRLSQRGEIVRRDPRLLEVHVFFFRGLVALDGKIR